MNRAMLLGIVLLVALPAGAQSAKNFSQADSNAETQRSQTSSAITSYLDAWTDFNNRNHLDERDGCYFKADGELTQILEIDRSGKVIGYYADKDNDRSRCWRETYLGVVFPKPPFAPYWHKMVMN